MRITCPHCHAEHCPEVLPACRARGDATRRLYARANGYTETPGEAQQRVIEEAVVRATAPLRAENARLRAEVVRLRAELTVPGRPLPPPRTPAPWTCRVCGARVGALHREARRGAAVSRTVLGIDPGLAALGWAIIERDVGRPWLAAQGGTR